MWLQRNSASYEFFINVSRFLLTDFFLALTLGSTHLFALLIKLFDKIVYRKLLIKFKSVQHSVSFKIRLYCNHKNRIIESNMSVLLCYQKSYKNTLRKKLFLNITFCTKEQPYLYLIKCKSWRHWSRQHLVFYIDLTNWNWQWAYNFWLKRVNCFKP